MFFSCNSDDRIVEPETEIIRENFAEFINPNITDPQIEIINENFHYAVFNELENERNELMVFLGGTISRTSGTSIFSEFAADKGFHVINLAYPNLVPVSQCSNETDIDCASNFRKEVFLGIEGSDLVTIDSNNSIANRLQKLLIYLTETDSNGNWQQYLGNNEIIWNKIVIAGHSQGAGHAAFIANQRNVKRVIMFAGPNDFSDFFNMPANWLSSSSVTPLNNYFAFLHLRDDIINFNIQEQCLMALGFNTIFNVDGSSSPFELNNALFTDKEPSQDGFGGPFHSSVVTDRFTPFENGQPSHSDVWSYLLGTN